MTRHYARRSMTGTIEIVDRDFDFVRAILPYDYKYTCNSQQWDEAQRICEALERPMISQGIARVVSGTVNNYAGGVTMVDRP